MPIRKRWLGVANRRVDKGYLLVLVICGLAVWPFLSRQALPQITDAELHIFRLVELSHLVRGGELYPRWAPDFYYGFGYPIFNYYAPLVYYLALPIELLPNVGPVAAVKVVLIAGLLLAGAGAYAFVRDIWGRAAGLVATAAYVYAPYVQFVDPHARGDVAESFSLAILPWTFWALNRLKMAPGAQSWLVAVLLIAAAILTHNLMAMVTFGLLLAWCIWLLADRGQESLQSTSPAALVRWLLPGALLAGVGLSAFFWLVVALEQSAVNLNNLVGVGGHFDYRNHFLDIGELLSPTRRLDWGATAPTFLHNLGLGQWLAGLGALVLVFLGRRHRGGPRLRPALFFILAALALIFMMLPSSAPLWARLPLLRFMQFPWRLLGATAFCLAVLAGFLSTVLQRWLSDKGQGWLAASLIGSFILLALPLTQVPPWPADFGPTDVRRIMLEELAGRWLGTTATADFVPRTVERIPRPEPALVDDYLSSPNRPDRVNRVTLPAGASVSFRERTPLDLRYTTDSSEPFLLRLFVHDFPGWQVYIDGQEVQTELGRPEGFIVVPVPVGQHQVRVTFETTPARTAAWLISLVTVLALARVTAVLRRRNAYAVTDSFRTSDDKGRMARWQPLLVVPLAITIIHIAILSPSGLLRYESSGYHAEPAQSRLFVNFGEQLALIGYDLPPATARSGQVIELTLYWQAQNSVNINYQGFVHLLDPSGRLVAQSDKLNPGEFPTKQWPVDRYVRDLHELILPPDLPQGRYTLSVGLWVAGEGWRLPVLGEQGVQLGDAYRLGPTLVLK
ncbi:MAG: hypothetical protein R3300_12950 [Candidatus Promineifilaceae bacterium]|nr:hypothetical protein [Candidatus Promineifilaceae bacterium]